MIERLFPLVFPAPAGRAALVALADVPQAQGTVMGFSMDVIGSNLPVALPAVGGEPLGFGRQNLATAPLAPDRA